MDRPRRTSRHTAVSRWAACLGLAGAFAAGGCHCGKKTDEEILRARIDTTSVHLYVATKIAVTKVDGAPEVAAARKQLFEVLGALDEVMKHGASPPATPAASSSASAAVVASAAPSSPPSAAPAPAPGHAAADYAKLAVALWKLRAEGKALVKSGREDDLPPVLPILLRAAETPTEAMRLLDASTEHVLFLMALFVVKFHPRSPAPVPDELLLYEAWKTRSDALRLEGFAPLAEALKAIVYGMNELCDLSAAEGARADATTGSAAGAVRALSGGKASLTEAQADAATLAARALAHGSAGVCYLDRGERPKAIDELDKFVTAVHALGTPPGETALLRAYIAYEKGDHDAARRCLEEARDAPGTDAETRRRIEALLPHVAKSDDGAIRKIYGKTTFMLFAVGLLWARLDQAGVLDALADLEVVRALHGYAHAAGATLDRATAAIPSLGDIKEKAKQVGK